MRALASEHGPIQADRPGVADALSVFTAPAGLFRRIEDTGAYGWPLTVLVGLTLLIGFAQVRTGLIDRVVDQQTERELAVYEQSQSGLVDRVELKERMDDIRKNGEFLKLMRRMQAIVAGPIWTVVSLLVISSLLYAAVALSGRKPEYHTILSIGVYAGFIELAAGLLRLVMMVLYRTTDVDTSLAMLAEPGKATILAAFDPFRFWFWIVLAIGMVVTQQLSRRMAIISCATMCLLATGARIGVIHASGA